MSRKILSLNLLKNACFELKQSRIFSTKQWNIQPTEFSIKTVNPLRIFWEQNQPQVNKEKYLINLQPGDPTLTGKIYSLHRFNLNEFFWQVFFLPMKL